MPPVPLKRGVYKIYAHIFGLPALATVRAFQTSQGFPFVTDRPEDPPFQQELAIEPFENVPGSPYLIYIAAQPQLGVVENEQHLWSKEEPREQWTRWHFEPFVGGLRIVAEKSGSVWRAEYHGKQIDVTPPKGEPQEGWTPEFVRPIDV
ncbi:hypothetical protein AB0I22_01000 [Streptomyces sp. NPDC050610]|uniref:hypothetical protein n=1 Tax=Streptomyces sp. NPDC050610 TaxID=3157097 RepID=UPI0034341079